MKGKGKSECKNGMERKKDALEERGGKKEMVIEREGRGEKED